MSDEQLIEELTGEMDKGREIIINASMEAIEYVSEAIENINDVNWRKMVVRGQALEMGAGRALADKLVPDIYNDMKKKMPRRLKINKELAYALTEIYIGRVVKNLVAEVNKVKEK